MDVVYAWCTGASFEVICGMTDIFEGSIIRYSNCFVLLSINHITFKITYFYF